jgi:hypothetical protein
MKALLSNVTPLLFSCSMALLRAESLHASQADTAWRSRMSGRSQAASTRWARVLAPVGEERSRSL